MPAAVPAGIRATAAALHELALQLADLILWLETERGEQADEAVLGYVREAVTVEIRHRRRTARRRPIRRFNGKRGRRDDCFSVPMSDAAL